MKPRQLLMEPIISMTSDITQRLTKAMAHRRVVERAAAKAQELARLIPKPVVDNSSATSAEAHDLLRGFQKKSTADNRKHLGELRLAGRAKSSHFTGFTEAPYTTRSHTMNPIQKLILAARIEPYLKAAEYQESAGTHSNVDSMLKGISQTPKAVTGAPDSMTEKTVAPLNANSGRAPHGDMGKLAREIPPADPQSRQSEEAEIMARRRRLMAILLPTLMLGGVGALHGGAIGAVAGKDTTSALAGGAIGGLVGGGLGAGAGGIGVALSKWLGGDPLTGVPLHTKAAAVADPQGLGGAALPPMKPGEFRGGSLGIFDRLRAAWGDLNEYKTPAFAQLSLKERLTRPSGLTNAFSRLITGRRVGEPAMLRAKAAYVAEPQGLGDNLKNLSELQKLVKLVEANPGKLPPAEDVLRGDSMTVPHGVVRGAAGAAGGAVLGNLLSRIVTGPIDPGGSERTASDIRRKRNIGSGIGGALGLYLASRADLQDPKTLESMRQKFAL